MAAAAKLADAAASAAVKAAPEQRWVPAQRWRRREFLAAAVAVAVARAAEQEDEAREKSGMRLELADAPELARRLRRPHARAIRAAADVEAKTARRRWQAFLAD